MAKGAKFNVMADDMIDRCDSEMDSYTVTVIATDPKGTPTTVLNDIEDDGADPPKMLYSATVRVMITVDAVDEPPIFTVTSDDAGDGVFTDVGKFAAVSFDEVTGIDGPKYKTRRRNRHCAGDLCGERPGD